MSISQQEQAKMTDAVLDAVRDSQVFLDVAREKQADSSVSDDQCESLYAYAHHLWKQGSFEKASHMFEYIVARRMSVARYWDALARCYYDMGEYEKTMQCYYFSSLSGGDPLHNLLYMAYSQFRLGELELCESSLRTVVDLSNQYPDKVSSTQWRDQAASLLTVVSQSLANKKTGKDNFTVSEAGQSKAAAGTVSSTDLSASNPPPRMPA